MPHHLPRFLGSLAILAGATTLAGVSSATAAASCQGQTPTIVGTSGAELSGNDGPDVIDTNGATRVDALGGDDLVCVTGGTTSGHVVAGAGDDTVDTTAASSGTWVYLGSGSDRLVAGGEREFVSLLNALAGDPDTDTVDTGAGRDVVEIGLGPGLTGADRVDLGAGDDRLISSGPTPDAHLDGGPGDDTMTYEDRLDQADWLFDNDRGLATRNGQPIAGWAGFDDFNLKLGGGTLRFVGGAGSEAVDAFGFPGPVDVRLGEGDDRAGVDFYATAGSTVVGGGGRDELRAHGHANHHTLLIDLVGGRAVSSGKGSRTRSLHGFEDAEAFADKVATLIGTGGPNVLRASARDVRLYGRGGPDDLRLDVYQGSGRAFGGSGADHLVGSRERDRLIGGPGRDTADGRAGDDVCRAEVRHRCERD